MEAPAPDAPSSRVGLTQRLLAAGLLVAILAFFVGQQIFIERHAEPYPGLVMPSFASAITPDFVAVSVPVIAVAFADGGGAFVSAQDLTRAGGNTYWVMNNVFNRGLDAKGESLPGLTRPRNVVRRFFDGATPGHLPFSRTNRAHHPETVAWLRNRLGDLYPNREPTSMRIAWATLVYRPDGKRVNSPNQTSKVVNIDL
jgi:hypothetical protein